MIGHLYRLSDPALAELDLESLLDQLLVRVKDILAVDTVAILLLERDAGVLEVRAAKGLEEEVEQRVRIPVGSGFAGRVASERAPIFIPDVEHADVVNPILREKQVRSLLGVPLVAEGVLLGVLHVGSLTGRRFTDDDAALLQLAAARAAPAIERAALFAALEREHLATATLQRSLLPDHLPDVVGIALASRYLPARDEVGGDWYDVIQLPRGLVGIAIGDVVGHGVRAAALMGQLRTALRAYAIEGHSPGQVLERVDRLLQGIRGRGMATAGYGVFDPEDSSLKYANAGHPPPLIVPASGPSRFLEPRASAPLGTLPYATYDECELTLGGNETILLYTDGLVEVRGESLDRGLDRLLRVASGTAVPDELCERVAQRLVAPEGGPDDIALVALMNSSVESDLRLHFPADPTVLAQVRQVVRRWLHEAGAAPKDINEITLAVGEACANAIEHAYSPRPASFELEAASEGGLVTLIIRDRGQWRPPRGEHRGRGLTIMEAVMEQVEVRPTEKGTEVVLRKRLEEAA
jgi:serine phosphatase RsbU (regulator of sigma subunit)/anti-sigma regulatory factor (Ser/Thr protein kinase)